MCCSPQLSQLGERRYLSAQWRGRFGSQHALLAVLVKRSGCKSQYKLGCADPAKKPVSTLYVALVPRPDHLQIRQRRRQPQQVDEARVAGDGDAPRAPVARRVARVLERVALVVE